MVSGHGSSVEAIVTYVIHAGASVEFEVCVLSFGDDLMG